MYMEVINKMKNIYYYTTLSDYFQNTDSKPRPNLYPYMTFQDLVHWIII